MIEVFKVVKGFEDLELLTIPDTVYHCRNLKIYMQHVRLNVSKFFFTQRKITLWSLRSSMSVSE